MRFEEDIKCHSKKIEIAYHHTRMWEKSHFPWTEKKHHFPWIEQSDSSLAPREQSAKQLCFLQIEQFDSSLAPREQTAKEALTSKLTSTLITIDPARTTDPEEMQWRNG